jgi:hypothetical protein
LSTASTLREILGDPPGPVGDVSGVLADWNAAAPAEYVEFANNYGDAMLHGYIFFAGAKSLARLAHGIGRDLEASDSIPGDVLPTPGGMLLWGNTIEGDQLFLVQRGTSRWTVSAWLRQWAEWYESELTIIDWLKTAFDNEQSPKWLPVWPGDHGASP